MATNITSVDPTLNSAGDVISLLRSVNSDRIRIQVQLSSTTTGAFFALQQVLPDLVTGAWSLAFSAFAGDVNCTEDIALTFHGSTRLRVAGYRKTITRPVRSHFRCSLISILSRIMKENSPCPVM